MKDTYLRPSFRRKFTTVWDKLSENVVTLIDSRLGECLVKGYLISASTDKRLRAVEDWSQKRVKRGLFEERFWRRVPQRLFWRSAQRSR